jgi:hypothetical protein
MCGSPMPFREMTEAERLQQENTMRVRDIAQTLLHTVLNLGTPGDALAVVHALQEHACAVLERPLCPPVPAAPAP